jgi:hypothetical protein
MNLIRKIFIIILAFSMVSCVTISIQPKKKKKKRSHVQHVETTHLGKNKYFFSKDYQRKLQKRAKKNRRR